MDILIDIECSRCGLKFSQGFGEMPHGRALKCPFCSNARLTLKRGALNEAKKTQGTIGHYGQFGSAEIKIKA